MFYQRIGSKIKLVCRRRVPEMDSPYKGKGIDIVKKRDILVLAAGVSCEWETCCPQSNNVSAGWCQRRCSVSLGAALAYSIVLSTKMMASVEDLDDYVVAWDMWQAVLSWAMSIPLYAQHSCNSQTATANEAINAGGGVGGIFSVCVVGVEKESRKSGRRGTSSH